MYEQGRRPSDSATASSETSNVTSRATTISDSNGDITLQQPMNPSNIQPKEDERSSISLTTLENVGTVADKKTDIQTTNNNQSDQINTQNQQQQPWVNPYWGSNWKPGATTAQSGTNNNNTNIKQISSATPVQQLIRGSILINDRGEINDSAWKQNIRFDSSTSNNLFNPGGKHISNGSGGPSGYLVPTHIRRQIVTSSPGLNIHPEKQFGYKRSSSSSDADTSNRPEFTRQQTFPQRTDRDIQPWVNPYWSKPNQINSQFTQNNNTNQNKNPQSTSSTNTWENPYWKDRKPQTSITPQQQGQPWENPYWKDKKPQTSTTSQQQGQQWENPYWKDKKPQTSTTSQQQGQPWQNPYWKDKKPQTPTTSQRQGQPWENPYWKDKKPQTSTTSQQQGQPQKNPYWKDWKPQTLTTSKQQGQPWENPYWKDRKPQTSTTSKQQSQPWENPYWKSQTSTTSKSKDQTRNNSYWKDWELQGSTISNQQQDKPWKNSYSKDKNTSNQGTNGAELNKPLSSESKTPAIPPFYERIYPPETVLSSSSERPKPMINDNDYLTFTIDKQGVAHYQAASSSPSGTNKTVNFASEPTVLQYPISSRSPPSVASTSQTLNATSSSKTANTASPPSFSKLSNYPPSSFNYSSSPSSSNVLTEEDVNNIQHALHSFATNSNSIPVIETSNEVPSSNIGHQNNSSSFSSSLFTSNQQQKSYQQPPSSPSPLASLFTSNRGQQSHKQRPLSSSSSSSSSESFSQNIQFNSLPYAYNSTSQKSTILSKPSYPSNSNEPLHRLIPKGPIVLI